MIDIAVTMQKGRNTMYHHDHQFADPSQIAGSYSDMLLMGGSSSNNNNSGQFGAYVDPAVHPGAYGGISVLQMLNPGGYVPTTIVDGSSAAEALYGSAFAADFVFGPAADTEMEILGRKRKKGGRVVKEVAAEEGGSNKNEKKRRERLSRKFEALKSLLPNSTKNDRATIIADSIDYINELLRTLNELKMLVDKKRLRRDGSRKTETGTEMAGDTESSCLNPPHVDAKGVSLRSSWLQRRSKETNVDVRIVEDEVFVKLVQHKRFDCLLAVSRALDELSLDLLHLSGGNMGDSHIFMINAKIHEGSSVYACAIAKKIIEAMEIKYP